VVVKIEYAGSIESNGVIGAWEIGDDGSVTIVCGDVDSALTLVRGLGREPAPRPRPMLAEQLEYSPAVYTVPSPRRAKRTRAQKHDA
jgi:hypothetical protein